MTRNNNWQSALACLALLAVTAIPAAAHSPFDYLEVFQVQPGAPVEHEVQVACGQLLERTLIDLKGPKFLAASIGCNGKKAPKQPVLLTGYAVQQDLPGTKTEVKILDFIRGGSSTKLKIATTPSIYFIPTQELGDGQPAEIPEGLDHFLAFPILDSEPVDRKVVFTGSRAPQSNGTVTKPRFVCLAAEEWHHEEHVEVTHRLTCFVLYELEKTDATEKMTVSVLDPFGLNQLKAQGSGWLAARGAVLESKEE